MAKQRPKRNADQPPRPKHGAHLKYEEKTMPAATQPPDPEDPLSEADADPEQLRWENEDERDLRPEWEDPDAPTSI